jgi:hypothetical protein
VKRILRKWLLIVGVAIIAVPPLYYYFTLPDAGDDLKVAITNIGFLPLIPAMDKPLAGSIAYINVDGTVLSPVCNADPKLRDSLSVIAPMSETNLSALKNSKIDIEGNILKALNLHIGSDDVVEVQIAFEKVSELDIDGSGLRQIEDKLLNETNCDATIQEWFTNKGLICQVQSTLTATVSFSAITRRGRNIYDQAELEKIKKKLETKAELEKVISGNLTLNGHALVYGVRFKPTCLTRDTDEEALIFPESTGDRMIMSLRLWMRRNLWSMKAPPEARSSEAIYRRERAVAMRKEQLLN